MAENRWDTGFGRWISDYGVAELVRALELKGVIVTKGSIYQWVGGTMPRQKTIDALLSVSEGKLTLVMIYEHSRFVDRTTPGRLPNTCKAGAV
jgi:hypothetical protein